MGSLVESGAHGLLVFGRHVAQHDHDHIGNSHLFVYSLDSIRHVEFSRCFRSQTGLLNLQFQFNLQQQQQPQQPQPQQNNNNVNAAAGADGAPAAPAAQPGVLSELVTFFASLVVSLFPGYNPPVRQQPNAPLDDDADPAEVLRRIDEVYEQQERERAARGDAEDEHEHED